MRFYLSTQRSRKRQLRKQREARPQATPKDHGVSNVIMLAYPAQVAAKKSIHAVVTSKYQLSGSIADETVKAALMLMGKYPDCSSVSEQLVDQALLIVLRHQLLASDTLYDELARVLGYARLPELLYDIVKRHLQGAARNVASVLAANRMAA